MKNTLSYIALGAALLAQTSTSFASGGLLSVLGSSVPKGYGSSGATLNVLISGSFSNGYAARLTTELASNGWSVVNQSIGGDTTGGVINRFYTDEVPVHADEDLIALSLGNEGLPGAANPQAVYNQFFTGITNLIAMSRANHIMPLNGNSYPRDPYTPNEYAYLKRMDLQLNTLNVPSVNFLGATDDGSGHWVNNSFINLGSGDGIHPNDLGHNEMYLTIVPSVFDALKAGKPTPTWGSKSQFLRLQGDSTQSAPLSFTPTLIMHSFSMSFRVRATGLGTVASVTLPSSSVHPTVEITATGLAYRGTNGVFINSGVAGTNGAWHEVAVAHMYARGQTMFYVDGVLAGTVAEHLTPVGFVLGGQGSAVTRPSSPVQADYQNWFVHRSMMNAEEVTAQLLGNLQQASLEVFAPLDDSTFVQGTAATNRAQSFSVASINGASANYLSVSSLVAPTNLTVVSNYTPAMVLNWSDPVAATEDAYYVERSVSGGAWTNLATLPAHATTYTDLAVFITTNYQYRVSYSVNGLSSDYAVSSVLSLPSTNVPSASGTILIDFGPNDTTNGKITSSPDVNGNYWNNMTATANGANITNLVTTNNLPSSLALTLTSSTWSENGIQNGGLLNPDPALLGIFAIPTVTEDYLFINQTYNTAAGTANMLLSGLNPALTYNFSMFGTRNNTGIRTTTYFVTDVNGTHSTNLVTSGTAVNSGKNPSNTAGNDKTIVTLNGLAPNASGQLTLSVKVGDSANFAYIAALEITSTASAPVFTVVPASQTLRLGTTNTLSAFAASTVPVSYQWFFTNTPLSGATSTNLVLSNVGYTNAGNYYVVATSTLGATTSAVAVVTVVTPHVPPQALLIDFGPNDAVNGNLTTGPDINGNYWNNMISAFAVANGLSITNLVTANNTPNTVSVAVSSTTWNDNGILNGGLLTPDKSLLGDFGLATATQDYFHLGGAGVVGTFLISGLNPALTYNLSMFATRNATDVRNTIYSVTDINGLHSVTLQTTGPGAGSAANPNANDDTIVSLTGLVPNALGQINFVVTVGAAPLNPFAYLGVLEIAPNGTAPVFTTSPQTQTNLAGSTSTLKAVATSSLPVNYQWYFSNQPLLGATGTDLLLANMSFTNAGSYYAVASNTFGFSTSAVAVVTVVAPPAFALLSPTKTENAWHLEFNTTAGINYHVMYAPVITGPWTDLGSVVGTAGGVSVFDDTNNASGQAFYRLAIP